ncbi:hypothetical protein NC651_029467 [Populus alba x Populus x berolinensis]|nr:hypothetical protein NC651_029467 [Populus alba x Populus x berolinensis]
MIITSNDQIRRFMAVFVDLLGRPGRVEEAYQLIRSMPFMADESCLVCTSWCLQGHITFRGWGNWQSKKALALRPNMVETYGDAKAKWRRKLARMRKLMKRAGCRKVAGRSWIEVRKPALKVKLTNQAAETSTLAHEHPGSFQAI